MRLLIGAVACLLIVTSAVGCRKSLGPQSNGNQAPETWITAAPQDTLTARDSRGIVTSPGTPGLIPVRFHIYWAGSDRDGAVTGFYWAVTETTAVSAIPGALPPPLPGPKAADYHFTTRTDSTFIFSTSLEVPDRVHTFYVYAVDDKGRADPTPARFMFRAYDRFPPIAVFDRSEGVGTVYKEVNGVIVPQTAAYAIEDSFVVGRSFPGDTVPSTAVIHFAWHGEATVPGMVPTGYRFKLDNPIYTEVDTSVHSVDFNTGVGEDVLVPGVKTFTLQTIGPSGWASQRTRFFQMNIAPDEWFSGPDLASPLWTTYVDGNGTRYWYRNVDWTTFATNGGFTGSLLSPDSAQVLPADRPHRRSFFEIYGNRIWAHQEGDTVSLNSWIVVPSGGSDIDSPYSIHIGTAPDIPVGVVTTPAGPNGSPVGFRARIALRRTDNTVLLPSESDLYPVFDYASIYHFPRILFYSPMILSGEAFLSTVAEDGQGNVDRRITLAGDAIRVVDHVTNWNPNTEVGTGGTDYENYARPLVLHFYVNHAPYLKPSDGQFRPTPGMALQIGTQVSFNVLADDIDPLDYSRTQVPGGPQPGVGPVLARTITLLGTNTAGRDTSYAVATGIEFPNISFIVPVWFQAGPATAQITVCDYRAVDVSLGQSGRCSAVLNVPVTLTGPVPADATTGASPLDSRPGSNPNDGRRQP
jgi:hypothetical protein